MTRTIPALFAFLLTSCTAWNQYTTPKEGDYHCHNADHSPDPNGVWCYPVDHTHTCCPENSACIAPDADGMSHGCAFQSDPNFVTSGGGLDEAKMPVSRRPEQP